MNSTCPQRSPARVRTSCASIRPETVLIHKSPLPPTLDWVPKPAETISCLQKSVMVQLRKARPGSCPLQKRAHRPNTSAIRNANALTSLIQA